MPAADSLADVVAQNDNLPVVNFKSDRGAKLNLIPAAADATKKESKLRNISTSWNTALHGADSKPNTEATK